MYGIYTSCVLALSIKPIAPSGSGPVSFVVEIEVSEYSVVWALAISCEPWDRVGPTIEVVFRPNYVLDVLVVFLN